MRRREMLAGLGAAAAWPLAAGAQQPAAPTIGFLSSRSPGESATVVAAFRKGLAEAGFVEGRNVAIAFRWAEGRYAQLPGLAAELVGLNVAVLLSAGALPRRSPPRLRPRRSRWSSPGRPIRSVSASSQASLGQEATSPAWQR
ncbi:MAG: hypothetical protein ACJ8CS_18110 [Microvirga sp.]